MRVTPPGGRPRPVRAGRTNRRFDLSRVLAKSPRRDRALVMATTVSLTGGLGWIDIMSAWALNT